MPTWLSAVALLLLSAWAPSAAGTRTAVAHASHGGAYAEVAAVPAGEWVGVPTHAFSGALPERAARDPGSRNPRTQSGTTTPRGKPTAQHSCAVQANRAYLAHAQPLLRERTNVPTTYGNPPPISRP